VIPSEFQLLVEIKMTIYRPMFQFGSFVPSLKLTIAPMIRQDVSSPYTNMHLPLPTLRLPAEPLVRTRAESEGV